MIQSDLYIHFTELKKPGGNQKNMLWVDETLILQIILVMGT